jgi:hypothetical protein
MNNGEYGITFRLATGYDMSGNTALQLAFTAPSGTLKVKSNPDVTAPAAALSDTPLGDLGASTYMEYTFQDGDIDEAGLWTVCGVYTDGAKKLFTNPTTFYVEPTCSTS